MASEDKTDKNKLEVEFHEIEKCSSWPQIFQQIRQDSLKEEYTVDEAKKIDNKFLNRYRDVNPYDHSRVILSRPGYSYINASLIDVQEARRKYILTQGPLSNTIRHFWLMVWEQNSKAIIMLNKLFEKNQSKCIQYWPTSISENENILMLPEVDLQVVLISENDFSHYIVRNIRLTNIESNESRDIIQFHYTTWPDFGVPQSPLSFLKFLRDVRQSGTFKSEFGPPIVHCSAGIGRSGTFCLVDSCLVMMKEKGVDNVNVKNVLLEMRSYRMGLIQTPDQLRFSYISLIQGLKVNWDSRDDEGLPVYETSGLKNGDSRTVDGDAVLPVNHFSGSSDSEEEAPPLPPPRFCQKPLPVLPDDSLSESESDVEERSDSSDLDNEETRLIEDSSSEEIATQDNDIKSLNELIIAGIQDSRKRKHSDAKDKSKRISEKVQEIKKKLTDTEKWKKQRSILINLTLGLSFVAISGAVMAYIWYRKSP